MKIKFYYYGHITQGEQFEHYQSKLSTMHFLFIEVEQIFKDI